MEPSVTVDGSTVRICQLESVDPALAELLRSQPAERWPNLIERALAVGARGLMTMGLGVDLAEVDERVKQSVLLVTTEAERHVASALDAAQKAMAEQLDPDHRSSVVAKAIEEFTTWRDDFMRTMDPGVVDSHTARLVGRLTELLGPDGALEERLQSLLDPDADGNALSALASSMDARFTELRDLIMQRQGAEAESERGTQKGFDFEDAIEAALRAIVTGARGAFVERTSLERGSLEGKVGDFVVTLGSGDRVVVEAKNTTSTISLGGKGGILAELDRGAANRQAGFSICVSAHPVFPQEVGTFGVFGNRVCVVDDGEGTMLAAALAWAEASLAVAANRSEGIDVRAIEERLQSLKAIAAQVSNVRRSLTSVVTSVNTMKGILDEMRSDLLAHVDDIARELNRRDDDADHRVVELHSA
ncbi:MAG: hypothetical protein OEY55_06435 [Acidimicrobiia bacterium]|nr:hypothetical protein [Acidimicrobiia bacterium]MDH5504820.1 hypothetical protein [Acidimicrobiia bacterium]